MILVVAVYNLQRDEYQICATQNTNTTQHAIRIGNQAGKKKKEKRSTRFFSKKIIQIFARTRNLNYSSN